jgi:hypothetical protein
MFVPPAVAVPDWFTSGRLGSLTAATMVMMMMVVVV